MQNDEIRLVIVDAVFQESQHSKEYLLKFMKKYYHYQREKKQNPYIGFTSFQHFRNDELYSDFSREAAICGAKHLTQKTEFQKVFANLGYCRCGCFDCLCKLFYHMGQTTLILK